MIGIFVLSIILLPLFAFMLAALSDGKKTAKVAVTFTGTFLFLVVGMVAGMAVLAIVLQFVVV